MQMDNNSEGHQDKDGRRGPTTTTTTIKLLDYRTPANTRYYKQVVHNPPKGLENVLKSLKKDPIMSLKV